MTDTETLTACPIGGERTLTPGEVEIVRSVFGDAIDYEVIRLKRKKFFPFQPRKVTMAPLGSIHFHPHGEAYCDDFAKEDIVRQGLLIHEMTHIWQTQTLGDWYLILHRHPFCRYGYTLSPGKPFKAYGIEQQAEIVKHAFWTRKGAKVAGVADKAAFDVLVNFGGATL